jgi:hypothetical protein
VTGTGAANYVARWTSSSNIGTGILYDTGSLVGVNTTAPGKTLDVFGDVRFQSANSRLDFTVAYNGLGDLPAGILLSTWATANNNLGIIPSAQGTVGSKVVLGAYNGSVWRSMVEFANTSGEPNLLLVKSAGNVGIGTSSPVSIGTGIATLDIQGSAGGGIAIGPSGTKNYIYGASTLYIEANTTASFYTNGAERMRITSGGSVGIGTTNPVQALSVIGNIYQRTGDFITWSNGDAQIGAVSGYALAFSTYDGSSSMLERMRITSAGNVGIGTTNPTGYPSSNIVLHIHTPSTNADIKLTNGATGTSAVAGGLIRQDNNQMYIWNSSNGILAFGTNNTERVNISSGGLIKFNAYGSGSFTGTRAYDLAVDSSGNIIEVPVGAGTVTGSGTANYVARWTSSSNISTGVLYDNGTNVGIGTASPTNRLQVNGTAGLNNSISSFEGSDFIRIYADAFFGSTVNWSTGDALRFATSADNFSGFSELMRITSAGSIGIGTTSPAEKLDVVGNLRLQNSSLGATIYFGSGAGDYLGYYNSDSYYRTVGSHYFEGAGFYKGMWNSIGYLGIGTTSPATKLQVSESGSNFFVGNAFAKVENTAGASAILYLADTIDSTAIKNFGSSLAFINSSTEGMRLTTTGLGIGTSSPAYKLDVNGNARAAGMTLNAFATGTSGGNLELGFDGSQGVVQAYNRSSGWIPLYLSGDDIRFNPQGAERMRITSGGNVGIGTTNPTYKLEVNGNVLTNELQYTKAININGADLNNVVIAGFYNGENLTNAPSSGWFWITVEKYSGDNNWAHQTATSFGSGNTPNEIYSRVRQGGTWTAWKKISYSTDTPTATSVYDLLPNARVDYTWVGQVIDGTWVDIFTRANNVLTSGTWMVNMYVSDFSTGGAHYTYTYSGTFTWYQSGTNQSGTPAASEIALHRMGHAANNTVLYLRTTEETAADGGRGKLQITGNYSHTSNTTINFKFVKII